MPGKHTFASPLVFPWATLSVTSGSGFCSGNEFIDQVTLAPCLVVFNQSIGVATSSQGFDGFDGVLGVGPVNLTVGTVSNANTVPTVTDNLFAQGIIAWISFEPSSSTSFTVPITFASIASTFPASEFWGINESINYGGTNILSTTTRIVDSGITLISISTAAFNTYQLINGAVIDIGTGFLEVTTAQFSVMKNLNFVIGGTTFTPNAQIFPRALNAQISIPPSGQDPTSSMDMLSLRGSTLSDTANRRVDFATTPFTIATTN